MLFTTGLTNLEGNPNQSVNQIDPCVESDGCRYLVAYSESTSALSTPSYVTAVTIDESAFVEILENRTQLGGGGHHRTPALASTRGAGDGSRRIGAVWNYAASIGIGGSLTRRMIIWSSSGSP